MLLESRGAIKRGGAGQLGDKGGRRLREGGERTGGQQAPGHSSSDASMGSPITASFLLFLAVQLLGQTGANPVYGSVSSADLLDFKVGPEQGPQCGARGPCDTVPVSGTSPFPCVFLL